MKPQPLSPFHSLFSHPLTKAPSSGAEQGFGQHCAHGSSQTSKVAGTDGNTPLVKGRLMKHSRERFLALSSVRLVSLKGEKKN